ncbi:MAG: adenine phosphoribosyltransferase [Dehalococcoidia bacterium]
MSSPDLSAYIRAVPDFPAPGVLFRDITPLLASPEAFGYAVRELSDWARGVRAEAVAGIESRGLILAAPIALALGVPFVPVRKPGKLPLEAASVAYELEYGFGTLEVHRDAFQRGQRVVVVDDLIATGGTAAAAAALVEELGAQVAGLAFLIELVDLGGRARLGGYSFRALLCYGGR